ncbi:hypothetical protein [Nocardia vaccinii]|uniref:hypothetical protein n=1 Tax=Nocardia vaccinii TaxID=1822 RepID=UPI0012F4CC34|nr:hypothetical protein [Nocardia vaccinii]
MRREQVSDRFDDRQHTRGPFLEPLVDTFGKFRDVDQHGRDFFQIGTGRLEKVNQVLLSLWGFQERGQASGEVVDRMQRGPVVGGSLEDRPDRRADMFGGLGEFLGAGDTVVDPPRQGSVVGGSGDERVEFFSCVADGVAEGGEFLRPGGLFTSGRRSTVRQRL